MKKNTLRRECYIVLLEKPVFAKIKVSCSDASLQTFPEYEGSSL